MRSEIKTTSNTPITFKREKWRVIYYVESSDCRKRVEARSALEAMLLALKQTIVENPKARLGTLISASTVGFDVLDDDTAIGSTKEILENAGFNVAKGGDARCNRNQRE